MRIMITGGTGFVGYHSAIALMQAGHEVCLLVRSADKAKKLYGDNTPDYVVGDIVNAAAIRKALQGCDGAIHSAAMVSTDAKDADLVYNTNLDGAKLVISSAMEQGVKSIIHVSSVTALYDPRATTLDGNSPLGKAKNAYGRSKVACEKYARKMQDLGAPICITYPASVIGPDDPGMTEPHEGLKTFLTRFIPVMPSGIQYVDVRDVAEVHKRLICGDITQGRYALGGHYVTWREHPQLLQKLTGRKLKTFRSTGLFMRCLGRVVDIIKRVKVLDIPMGYEAMVYATKWVELDNTMVEQDLNFAFRPLEDSMTDAIKWLHRSGHISAEQAGKLA